jgi:hypothetical protein
VIAREAAGRGSAMRRRRPVAPWAALLLALAPLPGAREIPVRDLSRIVVGSVPLRPSAGGLTVDVSGKAALALPVVGVEEMEIDHAVAGHLMLSWGSGTVDGAPAAHGAPWHRTTLPPGPGRVRLDLRTTSGFTPERIPFLFLEGTGSFTITGLRVRIASGGQDGVLAPLAPARLLAPLRIDHRTINTIGLRSDGPPGLTLPVLLGTGFVLLALVGAIVLRLRTRSWRLAPAIGVAAVAVALTANVAFAVRAAPAVSVALPFDPERRLDGWRDFDPELGPLAALARRSAGPGEKVGVLARSTDWFGWETLCFHLAPRRCVRFLPGQAEHAGLQGVSRLRSDELDVLVVFHPGEPLPAGWAPVAALNSNAYVARRR